MKRKPFKIRTREQIRLDIEKRELERARNEGNLLEKLGIRKLM